LTAAAKEARQQQEGTGRSTQQLQTQTSQLESQVKTLSSELEQTRAQREAYEQANRLFRQVSAMFTANEAEVVQKDQNVILRMKGVRFPSGKSSLGSENFPLLAKVNEVITLYPTASIVVEGHTDSVGGQPANMHLSQERADSVRNYLISTRSIPEDRISARGYGFSRPIATNKTSEGRALNRRIDIVVVGAQPTPKVAE
jgi:outer membrane protein OmpA-like peptidoglycan-associated protein